MTDNTLSEVQAFAEERARGHIISSIAFLNVWFRLLQEETHRAQVIAKEKEREFIDKKIKIDEFYFHARNLVHVFFAEVEGTSFLLRQVVLWASERGEISLSHEELCALRNVDPGTGRTRFPAIGDNLDTGIRYVGKLFDSEARLDKGGDGWRAFSKALRVRGEITHPKRLDSFNPAVEDLAAINLAGPWFYGELKKLTYVMEEWSRRARAALLRDGG